MEKHLREVRDYGLTPDALHQREEVERYDLEFIYLDYFWYLIAFRHIVDDFFEKVIWYAYGTVKTNTS